MNKHDTDFDTWYSVLQINVLDTTGVEFNDEDSARKDYDEGKCVYDVISEIVAEYGARSEEHF